MWKNLVIAILSAVVLIGASGDLIYTTPEYSTLEGASLSQFATQCLPLLTTATTASLLSITIRKAQDEEGATIATVEVVKSNTAAPADVPNEYLGNIIGRVE